MAGPAADGGDLVLRPTRPERLVARRHGARLPRVAVRRAAAGPDRWRARRGPRSTGRCRSGERRHPGGRDLVAVRERGPVAVADPGPAAPFARLAVSAPDAERVVAAIRQAP